MAARPGRRTYLDVLRGVAVLIMIEAHVIDSWTRAADRRSRAFGESMISAGSARRCSCFSPAIAVAMSAGRRRGGPATARGHPRRPAARPRNLPARLRLPLSVLRPQPLRRLGDAEGGHPQHHGARRSSSRPRCGACSATARARIIAFAVATVAFVWVTPIIRVRRGWPSCRTRSRGTCGRSRPDEFHALPVDGVRQAGALTGVLLDAARSLEADRRVNLGFAVGGARAGLRPPTKRRFCPPLVGRSRASGRPPPAFFSSAGADGRGDRPAYLWEQRPDVPARRWSPLQLLGRSSLFVYWIHVELVYGLFRCLYTGLSASGGAWIGVGVLHAS